MENTLRKSFRRWSRDNPPAGRHHSQQDALMYYLSLDHQVNSDWPAVLECLVKSGMVR